MNAIRNLLLITLLLLSAVCYSQHLMVSGIAEKTVAGLQGGSMLVFQTPKLWSLGVFYQVSITHTSESKSTSNPFYGVVVNAPLLRDERINFYAQLRMGLVEHTYVVVVPGLETEVKLSKVFRIAVGSAIRMTYPSLMARVTIRI